jgi:DNA-binding MarR family transcriptional regulator
METKEELIRSSVQQLVRIARKYARIEELPISIDGGGEVTTREAHIIQAIGEDKDLNVTNLANRVGITKSAASQMATKLAAKGFVEKRQAPHSNKEYLLFLTQSGWQVFHAHERFHGKDMTELVNRLNAFSLSQVATISVLLDAIGAVIDERLAKVRKK